jgi:hypothetical protein
MVHLQGMERGMEVTDFMDEIQLQIRVVENIHGYDK